MRWRIPALLVLTAGICVLVFFSLSNWRADNFELWRMRVNIRKLDTTHPQSRFERKVGEYVSILLGEGTNAWKNASDYEKKLLAVGRLCHRDFALSTPSDPKAYQALWKELGEAAPGAHLSPQGEPGPSSYVFTSVHAVAAVEDMPKLERVVTKFNIRDQSAGAKDGQYLVPQDIPAKADLARQLLRTAKKQYKEGRLDSAERTLERATKADPGNSEAWYYLHRVKEDIHDRDRKEQHRRDFAESMALSSRHDLD